MSNAARKVKRHPIRGAIAGLLGGVGLALILILYGKIAFGTATPLIVIGVVFVLSIVWGLYGPARRKKRPAPKGRPAAAQGPPPVTPATPPPVTPTPETPTPTPETPDEPAPSDAPDPPEPS